jgi:predicted GNAT superfamily acetyltransferase
MSDSIYIRPPASAKEYEIIEQLQVEIWGSELGASPSHLVLTIGKEGGIVLMAFDGETPVGFVFGFLGLTADGRLKLASHQAGVLPAYQDRGVGLQLKLAQREATLAKGLDLITWTFDPLQGRNGRLNLRKLGAVCNTYLPNLYGEMADALNQGLPSDRFRVDWWIASDHVRRRINEQAAEPDWPVAEYPLLNPGAELSHGTITPPDRFELPNSAYCLVEIPLDIAGLKQQAPELALKWRLQTRDIFETAFGQGYTVIDLLRRGDHNYYLLARDWQPN